MIRVHKPRRWRPPCSRRRGPRRRRGCRAAYRRPPRRLPRGRAGVQVRPRAVRRPRGAGCAPACAEWEVRVLRGEDHPRDVRRRGALPAEGRVHAGGRAPAAGVLLARLRVGQPRARVPALQPAAQAQRLPAGTRRSRSHHGDVTKEAPRFVHPAQEVRRPSSGSASTSPTRSAVIVEEKRRSAGCGSTARRSAAIASASTRRCGHFALRRRFPLRPPVKRRGVCSTRRCATTRSTPRWLARSWRRTPPGEPRALLDAYARS